MWIVDIKLIFTISGPKKLIEKKRLPGAGRHLIDADMDSVVFKWIISQREKKIRVTRRMIIAKAKEIHQYHVTSGKWEKDIGFEITIGWLQKFMARHNISCRIPTTVCQKPPASYEQQIVII